MTENKSFSESEIKNRCRGCLQTAVYPMTAMEINTYQNLTGEVTNTDINMYLCLFCRWTLRKCIKFTKQCIEVNEILNRTVDEDTKSNILLQKSPMYNLKSCPLVVLYFGPMDVPDLNTEASEEPPPNDASDDDDDDELPLVMLQNDYKQERRDSSSSETKLDTKIKEEPEIKEEYKEELCTRVRKQKKKKEVKEGFSSRMVQETDEYVVIKLTKEEVLAELAERIKSDSYIRAPYKCDKCVKGFNFEEVLYTHMEKHRRENGTYQCDICTQYCPSPVSLRGHIKSHTTRYKCKLCGQVRLSRQHLLEHHAISHTQAAAMYTCEKCNFTTNKRTTIQRHVKSHTISTRHACHHCGKLFNTVETLRVHMARHDKSKRFQCKLCKKHFIYPSLLQKHIVAVHERKDYYCVECDVKFKSPDGLRLHFKRAKKHRDSSSYKHECPQCPQRFFSASTLSVHLSSSHGAPKQHSCDICRRQYSNREALRAHMWRVHHGETA